MSIIQRCYNFIMRRDIILITRSARNINNISNPIVLGIETSCDDTGCGIVNGNRQILGESLYSQNEIHIRYGGVNPLVAYDLHRANIELAVNDALTSADIKIDNIDVIAVTTKPGMLINLQVGVKYAKYIARMHNKPLMPIHHMEAHALAARMFHTVPYPFIVLLISGGHCLLAVARNVDDFLLLGECLDNPPGEVMDKAARRMKLKNIREYSKVAGGRAIELAASKAENLDLFKFPLPLARNRDCNFSFSGLKDSLVRKLKQKESEHKIMGDEIIPEVNDLCASFQTAISEHLAHRTERGILFCEKNNLIPYNCKNIVVSGGVACNDFIFKSIQFIGEKFKYNVVRPPPKLCTDNGIMIAWNGVERILRGCAGVTDINLKDICPEAPLGKDITKKVKESNLQVKVTRLENKYTNLKYLMVFLYITIQA